MYHETSAATAFVRDITDGFLPLDEGTWKLLELLLAPTKGRLKTGLLV